MFAELLISLSLLLLLYYAYFSFYNYYYAIASFFRRKLKTVMPSGKPVAIVIVSFNEEHVIADTIKQCEALTYKNKVIIVGDDSKDNVTYPHLVKIAKQHGCVKKTYKARAANQTIDLWESPTFVLFHRHDNKGFKAGNLKELQYYLESKEFEYMYLLDADWWPQKNAIERTLSVLEANPKLAYVQTQRVSYHGEMTNWEKCLALSEDGCYYADLPGRAAVGDMILFTGCCTLFRLTAVNRVGGFHPGHLTEDIDLSNRLYIAGYKAAYLEDVANEGEVPPHYHSYRRQQERWTMGTARTFKEYIIPIFKSSKLTFREKSSMFRQNAYYTGSVAVEFSIILAFITTVFLSTASHTIEASTFEYYFDIIGFPYALIMFVMLLSNFAPPVVVAIKRRSLMHVIYAPFATWLSWSLLHTYFIGNIKGLLNIKRDWAVTPKGMRKHVKHFASHVHHVRIINFITLALLLVVYSIEWVQFGIVDPFAFFWIPALSTGVFFS